MARSHFLTLLALGVGLLFGLSLERAAEAAGFPLAITADNKSRSIGQTNPPLSATYSGFVNGDTVSNLDVAVTLFTAATSNSPAGTYAIEAGGAADADYDITHFNGVLTITNPVPAGFGPRSFTNTTSIVIPDSGASAPYPSVINVAGLDGTLGNVTVTLRNLTHTWTRDIDVLLVGPGGQALILCSDAGNGGVNNVTFTLADSAALALPLNPLLNNTAYQPGNFLPAEIFPAPAPAAPYGTNFAVFHGQPYNGTWSLYVFDGGPGDRGSFAGGWSLTLTTFSAGGVPPVISGVANQTINEDGTTAILNFTVSDAETPAANLTLSQAAANPSLVPMENIVFGGSGSNRTVVVTPVANRSGTTAITLTVSDGTNYTSANFLLTVLPVNDAPVITPVADQSINEDAATSPLSFTVGDVETLAGNLTLAGGSSNPALVPTNRITFSGSGSNRTVLVNPAPDAHGTALITLTVSDGTNSASTSFVLTVHPLPDLPTIASVADQVISEDGVAGPLSVLVNSVDLGPQNLTLRAGSSNPALVPTNSIVFGGSGSNRTATLAPMAEAHGTAVITLTVSDGTNSASANFLLTVQPVNDVPLITSPADLSVNEDAFAGPVFFNVGDVETPPSNLVMSASSSNLLLLPVSRIVLAGSGSNRFAILTPVADAYGSSQITLTVRDGTNSTSTSFLLTVNPVNDAPSLATVDAQSIDEDGATGFLNFTVGDGETPAASLTLSGLSSNPALVPTNQIVFGGSGSNRTVRVTPQPDANGTVTLTLRVSDGTNVSSTSFLLTVRPVNDVPFLTGFDGLLTNNQDTVLGPLPFAVGDMETSAENLVVSGGSSNPLLVPTGNIVFGGGSSNRTVSVTPAAGEIGLVTITLTVSDGTNSASTNFLLRIKPVNLRPTLTGVADQSIVEDGGAGPLNFTVADEESPAGSLVVTGGSSNPALAPTNNILFGGSGSNRTVTVVPALNQHGVTTIFLTVSDGTNSLTTNFVLTVSPVNDMPTITGIGPQVIAEDNIAGPLAFTVGDVETSPEDLVVTGASSNPELVPVGNMVFSGDGSNRTVNVTPVANGSGTALITMTVSDGTNRVKKSFLLTVNAVNDPPTLTGVGDQVIDEDDLAGPLELVVSDVETPAAGLVLSAASSNPALIPTNRIVFDGSGSNRTVMLSPLPLASGTAMITLAVSDGTNVTSTNFLLTVVARNYSPTITGPGAQQINEDGAAGPLAVVIGDVETAAADLSVNAVSSNPALVPVNQIVFGGSGSNRTVTVTPAAQASGLAYIILFVTDGTNSASTFFLLTVLPVNDPPVLAGLTNVVINEDAVAGPLPFVMADVETLADDLTLEVESSNLALVPLANIFLNGGGSNRTLTLVPLAETSGSTVITLTVSDGTNLVSTNFLLTVNTINDAPTISGVPNQTIIEDTATEVLAVLIGDAETPAGELALSGDSSNPTLVPVANIVFGGSGSNRTVLVTPVPDASGLATITLTVSDGTNNTSTSFLLDVTRGPVTNYVARWGRFEAAITNETAYADPYRDVTLNVTYTKPDASTVNFWGFHDGSNTWRMRFMPDQLGWWNYTASFSDGSLSTTGQFLCVVSDIPGLIGADETNPQWFGFKGGGQRLVRSFHVGDRFFAANWPATNRTAFLDWAQGQGYNMLAIGSFYLNRNANGRGQGWNTPDLWDGGTHSLKANEYQKMEAILDDLANRKMVVFPFAGFFGKSSDFPTNHIDQELYLRYTLARVGPYWNMVFNVAGPEPLYATDVALFQNAMGMTNLTRLGNLVKSLDVFGHLVSDHNVTGENAFKDELWEDFTTLQGPKTLNRQALSAGLLEAHTNQPLYAIEALWPGNTLGHPAYSNTDIRKNGFVIMMSAAALNFGDMNGTSSSGFSGSLDLAEKIQSRHDIIKQVWDFFETQTFQRMRPRQDLVNNGFCLAEPGHQYLVYLQSHGSVSISFSNGPYAVTWINAQNPQDRRVTNNTLNGLNLAPPPDGDDWLVHLVALAPTITGVPAQTIDEDGATAVQFFTVDDLHVPAAALTMSAGSSHPSLVPTNQIVFGGSGSNRSVTVTPLPNAFGVVNIILTVSNGTNSTSTSFPLTINPVDDPPTITGLDDQWLNEDSSTQPLSLLVGDLDTAAAGLTLSAASSNPYLLPTNRIVFGGSGSNRTVTVTPAANVSGTATITVTLRDATNSASTSFLLNVQAVEDAPTILGLSELTLDEDAVAGPLIVVVGDAETAADDLWLDSLSSNPGLVPTNQIVFGGSGSNRTVTVTPAADAHGTAVITLVVSDGTNTTSASFLLTVNPVNDAPRLGPMTNCLANVGEWLWVTNQAVDVDGPEQTMTFALLDSPEGAALDPINGVFAWRPIQAQVGTTNLVVWMVADSGVPALGATQSFNVIVRPLQAITVTQVLVNNDEVTLQVGGNAGVSYTVQASEDLADWTDLFTTNAPAASFPCTVTNVAGFPRRFFRILLGP